MHYCVKVGLYGGGGVGGWVCIGTSIFKEGGQDLYYLSGGGVGGEFGVEFEC